MSYRLVVLLHLVFVNIAYWSLEIRSCITGLLQNIRSAEAIDLGHPYWILHPASCQTPEAVTTVFKCSWGWTQIASETCRLLLQLLINILPSSLYILTYDARKIKHKICFSPCLMNFSTTNLTPVIHTHISGASRKLSVPCLGSSSVVGHPCLVAVKLRSLGEGCTTDTCMSAYWLRVSFCGGGGGGPWPLQPKLEVRQ
jgi:hypothetical protein